MTEKEIRENLCLYDARNPHHDPEDGGRHKDCCCDNCFYGRDELAVALLKKSDSKEFTATACRWFDRTCGNTYHSVQITRHKDGKILHCPFQYGYDDHYRQTALQAMQEAGWIKDTRAYERLHKYPIIWEVSDGLKRDCVAHGKE